MPQAAIAPAPAPAPGPTSAPASSRLPSHVWRILYRKLRVREAWSWMDERLHLYALRGNTYEPIARSEVLPGLDHELLLRFIDSLSVTKAVREFPAALAG
ncbi:hypothetical protein [Paraliomyxa miuraensis]|uniref:hypothetical protein n=1 Tax=Paraliomyxa miuraensis TaxID=376150 RepID=UPI00224D5D70|nr:hypothetical protein [Paraliomyxa miuraensis]MCX4241765.1 hypothetical protein [Paraliomyxa miuraensis]